MKGLVLTPATKEVTLRDDLARPTPATGEVLIRVHAVALNPVDELYVSRPIAKQDQRIIGTDFAGVVVEVGASLASSPDSRARVGARVSGFLQGACSTNDRPGAFAEFVAVPYDLVWAVPSSVSFEAAAAVSMCCLTAAQGIFARLGLPSPFPSPYSAMPIKGETNNPINVFIYASSTSLGMYAAQLVRLSPLPAGRKLRLIGAASKSKHGLLRQAPYSYDALVDYRDADWTEQVRALTGGRGVDYALDCISEGETVTGTDSVLAEHARSAVFRGPPGGRYNPAELRVKPIYGAVWEGLGVEIGYNGNIIKADPVAHDFATKFYDFLSSSAETDRPVIQPNPLRKMPGGLARIVPDGLALLGGRGGGDAAEKREEDYMRPISGEKLVYTIK